MNNSDTQRNQQARDLIVQRIRHALSDVPTDEQPEQVVVSREYRHTDSASRNEIIEQFIERVTDYKAEVRRVDEQDLPLSIAALCLSHSIQTLVIPFDMPPEWLPQNVTVLRDQREHPLTYDQLEQSDGVLTGCVLGIAQTGTIVLNGGALQGRRVLSLLPDYALCLIWEEQIVGLVPEAITQLNESQQARRSPLTFISGPSATSDIELSRVEGVHGPRTLNVLVVQRTH